VLVASLALSLFGVTDEYHQLYTVNRSGADVGDWVADTLGGCFGAVITSLFYVRFIREGLTAPSRD
jgi:VanZ family protein